DLTSLPVIAIEQAFVCFLAQYAHQFFGEIERVMNAAVEAHSTDRAVHMCGIARQYDPADPECLGDALMHRVEIKAADFGVAVGFKETFEPSLKLLRCRQLLFVCVGIGRK